MRGPTARLLGTLCCQVRWHVPPITSRSPGPGVNPWVIGGIALAILLALLFAVIAFGGGREHS